jgi:hypothetical protein
MFLRWLLQVNKDLWWHKLGLSRKIGPTRLPCQASKLQLCRKTNNKNSDRVFHVDEPVLFRWLPLHIKTWKPKRKSPNSFRLCRIASHFTKRSNKPNSFSSLQTNWSFVIPSSHVKSSHQLNIYLVWNSCRKNLNRQQDSVTNNDSCQIKQQSCWAHTLTPIAISIQPKDSRH